MKLALISDLHFGTIPPAIADELAETLLEIAPDLCVIAGDLTARARPREFGELTAWLDRLRLRLLITPGNHDLPYWNLYRRFTAPFKQYLQASGARTLLPFVKGQDGLVLGLNTTRSWQPHFRWQEGVVRRQDMKCAAEIFSEAPSDIFKAVATHHPLVKIARIPRARAARHAAYALENLARQGVEVLMSGHLHLSFVEEIEVSGRTLIAIGAPTALSWRKRGEPNGFWVIESTPLTLISTLWFKGQTGFAPAFEQQFSRGAGCYSGRR